MPEQNNSHSDEKLYRYEDILRAIGRVIDEEGMQDVIIIQTEDGIKVHGYQNASSVGGIRPKLIEHQLSSDDLRQIDEEARRRRGRDGFRFFG